MRHPNRMPIEGRYTAGMKQDAMSTTFGKKKGQYQGLGNFCRIRMSEVGMDLWKSFGSTLLLTWDHLQPVAQDCVQTAFEYLQE